MSVTKPKRVAVASFALEANVFNPIQRRLEDFCVLIGSEYAANQRQVFLPFWLIL